MMVSSRDKGNGFEIRQTKENHHLMTIAENKYQVSWQAQYYDGTEGYIQNEVALCPKWILCSWWS